MTDYFSRALKFDGEGDADVLEAQSPVPRPAPVPRPGFDVPREAPPVNPRLQFRQPRPTTPPPPRAAQPQVSPQAPGSSPSAQPEIAQQPQLPSEPPQAAEQGSTDYFSRALRGGGPTQQAGGPPNIEQDNSKTLGFMDQARASFAPNDEKWVRSAARALYPKEPVDDAVRRFKKAPDGRYYHVADDGKAYEVTPQSGLGRLQNIGSGVGPALPAVSGAVSGILTFPFSGPGSIPAAGIGGYAGEVARQYIGNQMDDGPEQYNRAEALKEGVVGGIGQGVGVGLGRWAARHNPVDIAYYDPNRTQQLYGQAQNVGVRLTPAEATNMSSLIGEQKRLQASPRAANEMSRFLEERNQEVGTAWRNYLNSISPPRDASVVGRRASEAAEGVLERAQTARTAAVNPLYQQAEQQIPYINPGAIVQFVNHALPNAKGSERSALQFVQRQMELTGNPGTVDMSFRGLNGVKMAIDSVLENPDLAAKQGIDRHAHRTLAAVREMLIGAIDGAPGAGGAAGPYATGRQLYGQLTEQTVTPVQEVLAPLLRVNGANSSIVRAAESVLDPATRSPELVAQARQLIQPQHPRVWDSMIRQFLQEHAEAALQENAKGFVSNAGGNIAKRVGTDSMEANLREAMTPRQFRRYQEIVDVFRATGRAMDTNSDTAFKAQAIEQAKNAAGGSIARMIRNVNPAKLVENTADWFANANYERQAAAIARIFVQGDQAAINNLRALRQLSPADYRRRIMIGHLLSNAGEFGAEKALGQ